MGSTSWMGEARWGLLDPTTNGEATHAHMGRAEAGVRTSLRVAAGSKGVAALPGVAAPRGDGERLGAAGLCPPLVKSSPKTIVKLFFFLSAIFAFHTLSSIICVWNLQSDFVYFLNTYMDDYWFCLIVFCSVCRRKFFLSILKELKLQSTYIN